MVQNDLMDLPENLKQHMVLYVAVHESAMDATLAVAGVLKAEDVRGNCGGTPYWDVHEECQEAGISAAKYGVAGASQGDFRVFLPKQFQEHVCAQRVTYCKQGHVWIV